MNTQTQFKAFTIASFAGLSIAIGAPAMAQQRDWLGGTSTNWFTASNWTPQGVPSSSNPVVIDPGLHRPCIILLPGAMTGELAVGGAFEFADLTIQNIGTLQTHATLSLGFDPGSIGRVTVTGPSASLHAMSTLLVGWEGRGELTISDGATLQTTLDVAVAYEVGSSGKLLLTGADTTWNHPTNLGIGDWGSGEMIISGGADLHLGGFGTIGSRLPASGTLTVTGPGSSWSTQGFTLISDNGDALMVVENGATASAGGGFVMGTRWSGEGTLRVTGAGSTVSTPVSIAVGLDGIGEVLIEDGGLLDVGTFMNIGQNSGGFGLVTLTGQDSHLDVNGSFSIGYATTGEFNILAGATAESGTTFVGRFPGSTGNIFISGANSTWTPAALFLGGETNGSLTLQDGGKLTSQAIALAAVTGSTGVLNIGAAPSDPPAAPGILDVPGVIGGNGSATVNLHHTGDWYSNRPNSGNIQFDQNVAIHQSGPGTSTLTIANTHTGGTSISDGVLRIRNESSLGADWQPTVVMNGGVLQNYLDPVTLSTNRTIHLAQQEGKLRAGWFFDFRVRGPITGPGDLVIANDNGTVVMSDIAKSYTGRTVIGANAASGGYENLASLRLQNSNIIPATSDLRFNPGTGGIGTLVLQDVSQTVKSLAVLSGEGEIRANAGRYGSLTVTGAPGIPANANLLRVTGDVHLILDGPIPNPLTLDPGARVSGGFPSGSGGSIGGTLTVAAGAAVSPGSPNSPTIPVGRFVSRGLSWQGGSALDLQFAQMDLDAFTGSGVGWDTSICIGILEFNASAPTPLLINLSTIDPLTGLAAPAAGFDPDTERTWLIMRVINTIDPEPIVGFNPSHIALDVSEFQNSFGGAFSVELGTDGVYLRYSPVPPFCEGDADGSGTVDFGDITAVLSNWGVDYTPGTGMGDANTDSIVNFADITAVLSFFGQDCQ